jgi:hypothetical protein
MHAQQDLKNILEKKRFIIDNLPNIKTLNNHERYYQKIMKMVDEENVSITKNKRGFFFNLNQIKDDSIDLMYEYIKEIISLKN